MITKKSVRSTPEADSTTLDLGIGMTRRRFAQFVTTLGALGCIEPHAIARALDGGRERRLSWRAYRSARAEGSWPLGVIEGEVPRELNGDLLRIAPGQTENHGVLLNHFFDGDAFVMKFRFREGSVHLDARFVNTPEREKELAAGRMLYSEFGTQAPTGGAEEGPLGGKNQPNVNIIPWDGRYLALSEGGHPTAVDPTTLAFQSRWDFHGTLPPFVPFTAHPKFDPVSGVGYGYGVAQGPGMALKVYRMNPSDGKLTELYSLPQKGYFMIHDMLLTKEHLVFVIPPVRFDLAALFSGESTVSKAIRYFEEESTSLLILRRDGRGEPVRIEQPASMVFHNGNAFEEDGKLVVDTILSPDAKVLELLDSFTKDRLPEVPPTELTRFEIDLASGAASRTVLDEDQEFPRFDLRRTGASSRYLYTMEGGGDDPLVSTRLVRRDLESGATLGVDGAEGQGLGETIYVERGDGETAGWLLGLGYDTERDETFLDLRDAGTLDRAARIWTGHQFPLGFHGNWKSA